MPAFLSSGRDWAIAARSQVLVLRRYSQFYNSLQRVVDGRTLIGLVDYLPALVPAARCVPTSQSREVLP